MKKILLIFILFCSCSYAKPISVGFGVGYTEPGYKGYDRNWFPVPMIEFENNNFYIKGLNSGVYLYSSETDKFSVGFNYLPLSFKTRKTKNHELSKLNNRKSNILAEVSYSHTESWGKLTGSVNFDFLNESNTIFTDLNYSYSKLILNNIIISPSIGVNWFNKDHNNYYYGITASEHIQSGLPQFTANSSFIPYLGLSSLFMIEQNWNVFLGTQINKRTGQTRNSPMLSTSIIYSFYTGIFYTF